MPWLSIARRDGEPGPEWRQSDWPVTDNLNGGRACPECHATVHKGARWRAHWAKEKRDKERIEALDQAVRTLARAVRQLATEAGHGDWYGAHEDPGGGGADPGDASPLTGYVLGSGPLPEEMRGGGE